MREEKIGVLIVGEMHLDDRHKVDVDNLFGRAIRVEFTPDETASAARAGLAFLLNKGLVETLRNIFWTWWRARLLFLLGQKRNVRSFYGGIIIRPSEYICEHVRRKFNPRQSTLWNIF
jgi:hypothetical protein